MVNSTYKLLVLINLRFNALYKIEVPVVCDHHLQCLYVLGVI